MSLVAKSCFNNTQYLYKRLSQLRGVTVLHKPRVFNEFVWKVDKAQELMDSLKKQNIIAGYYLGDKFSQYKDCILSCCTEKKSKEDIDAMVTALASEVRWTED